MSNLNKDEIALAKSRGFLLNRNTDCFSGRIVAAGGVYSASQLERIAECARLFGSGKVIFTSRLNAEVVGIPHDKLDGASEFISADDSGLAFGGTGSKIRPITSCKGTTCVFGCSDTQELAGQLHELYYIGRAQTVLPAKFKIGVGGCPNSCMKQSLNDFGIEARRSKDGPLYQIFVGGMWGRHTRSGTPLPALVGKDELFSILDKVISWFADNALPRERLGTAIDRLGVDNILRSLDMDS